MIKKIPIVCPSCSSHLKVERLKCSECETKVEGSFSLPVLALLSPEEQTYVVNFLKASGSIKEMSSQMGMSYPTMRNQLDELIEKIKTIEQKHSEEN